MDIALHLGAHLTDEGRLLRCLAKNRALLAKQGIDVPERANYRDLLLKLVASHPETPIAPDTDQLILDAVVENDDAKRVILSDPDLLAWQGGAVRSAHFYPAAPQRLAALRDCFKGHDVTLFVAIRNPASFLPALLDRVKRGQAEKILNSVQPEKLRWSAFAQALQSAWPEAKLTIWCDEDTPFIWHRLLQVVGGYTPDTPVTHSFEWFDEVMVPGGAAKLEHYLTAAPPVDDAHRQRVIGAFLDKFCDEAKIEVDVSVAGWSEEKVDLLSELYEEDVITLASMGGVTFIQP